ncbi:ribonuclease P protein subunit p30 [Aplochiton taeniatus]
MSAFMDLNIGYTADKKRLQSVIETAAHLGYSTVAINYVVETAPKKKQEIPKPDSVAGLFDTFPIVQGKSRSIKVLNRLTIVATDASHFRPNSDYKAYDLIAVYPSTDKLFHAACTMFEVDIICVAITEKLPFFFKRSAINPAMDRGVFFEISYSPAIKDSTMRRYTIANSLNLMDVCKGKNVIVSSGADKPLELRGPYDIANLGQVFGLGERDAKDAVSTNCRSVVIHGETRKTAMGVVRTMRAEPLPAASTSGPTGEEEEEEDEEGPAAKKPKTHT